MSDDKKDPGPGGAEDVGPVHIVCRPGENWDKITCQIDPGAGGSGWGGWVHEPWNSVGLGQDGGGGGVPQETQTYIEELQSQLHRAQCEVTELQNTLRLDRELRERYESALKEIFESDAFKHGYAWRVAREALRVGGGEVITKDLVMQPGRELDALIAEKVMGYVNINTPDSSKYNPHLNKVLLSGDWFRADHQNGVYQTQALFDQCSQIPRYSTDLNAAWKVVDQLGETHRIYLTSRGAYSDVDFSPLDTDACRDLKSGHSSGVSAPHAICLAALRATGHNI